MKVALTVWMKELKTAASRALMKEYSLAASMDMLSVAWMER